jgi:acylaminoacyl-peptidase
LNLSTGDGQRLGSSEVSYGLLDVEKSRAVLIGSYFSKKPSIAIYSHGYGQIENDIQVTQTEFSFKKISIENGATGMLLSLNKKDAPLVVKIHGGPHACALNSWSVETMLYLKLGFNILFPNYRGSTGVSEKYLESLAGHCGDYDVMDCYNLTLSALEELKEFVDPRKVVVYGGSHGGFLTAHLLGNPETQNIYCAGVLWNPVTDMLASHLTSDIPEWSVCEVVGNNGLKGDVNEFAKKAIAMSPIANVENVRCPSLVVLGESDLRVNFMGGVRWAQALEEKGADIQVLSYPGEGHSISGPECSDHVVISIASWILNKIENVLA